jgi:hypothetical protein
MRRSLAGVLTIALGAAAPAMAVDITITGLKLIILDKMAAASQAKMVYVSKDGAIAKGSGTDAGDIDAQLDISGTTGPGSFVMPQGANWLVNKDLVAKYVNKNAPSGGSVKVSVIKPQKLIKVVAKSLGDTPIDISAPPAGPVLVVHTVTNGGVTTRHCTQFSGCAHKVIAGGGNYKMICKGNSGPVLCPGSPSGAFLD